MASSLCYDFQTLWIHILTKKQEQTDFLVSQKVHFYNTANSSVKKPADTDKGALFVSFFPKSSKACHVLSEDASWLTGSVFSLILDLEHRIA